MEGNTVADWNNDAEIQQHEFRAKDDGQQTGGLH